MNKLYQPPDMNVLKRALAQAGADEKTQISGALWIYAALRGIGVPKTSADELKNLKKMQTLLGRVSVLADDLPALHQTWFAQDVVAPVQRALGAVTFALNQQAVQPKQNAHKALNDALQRLFEAEGLIVTISLESPFVSIFAHCTSMDLDVAKTTLNRIRK